MSARKAMVVRFDPDEIRNRAKRRLNNYAVHTANPSEPGHIPRPAPVPKDDPGVQQLLKLLI